MVLNHASLAFFFCIFSHDKKGKLGQKQLKVLQRLLFRGPHELSVLRLGLHAYIPTHLETDKQTNQQNKKKQCFIQMGLHISQFSFHLLPKAIEKDAGGMHTTWSSNILWGPAAKVRALTVHIQLILGNVRPQGVAGFTAVCAIVSFVEWCNDEFPAFHDHALHVWQLSAIFRPDHWLWSERWIQFSINTINQQ